MTNENGAAEFVACLPMYDWPEIHGAVDRFWAGWRDAMRARGLDAPERLDRSRPAAEVVADPRLLVGQCCGAPFADAMTVTHRLLATPCYDAPGCQGPFYASWIVTRPEHAGLPLEALARMRAAVNGYDSYSGWRALRRAGPSPAQVTVSGAHRLSARAVAAGEADFAAIDAAVWTLLRRHEPETAGRLVEGELTTPAPAPPFVSAAGRTDAQVEIIRAALDEALTAPELAESRAAMLLGGVETLEPRDYRPMGAAFDPAA